MRNKEVLIETLSELVAIKSISGAPEGEYPFGKGPYEALEYTLKLCESYGFKTKMCGKSCGFAEIGQGEEIFGILVHLDVVPEGDGWNTNPFEATIIDDKIYGRGVSDDKGPTIAVIHAMKEIIENNVPLNKRVRIIFGTSEETGDEEELDAYKNNEELPTIGFTPDAEFPVVYLEKGIARVQLSMSVENAGITYAEGGIATNMVPDKCKLGFMCGDEEVIVEATGRSAHGSTPELGENAIGNAMNMIARSGQEKGCDVPFAKFYNTCIGTSTDGVGINCNFCDEDSGETTVNPGLINIIDGKVVVEIDMRCALCCTPEKLVENLRNVARPYGVEVELAKWVESVHMDKNCEFVQTLMDVYNDITGENAVPSIMGGGTYARSMKNIVAFGPIFIGREATEHQANEYVYVEDLMKSKEIYYEVIARVCR